MSAPPVDHTLPLNTYMLEQRDRHGHREVFCSCGGWVRISKHYQGDCLVMRAINHNPPCANYEAFIKDWQANPEAHKQGLTILR